MNVTVDYSSTTSYISSSASTTNETSTEETSVVKAASSGRKSYLQQLRDRFDKLKISIGDYQGGIAGRGSGNVKLSAKYLAKAQQDPEVAAELESCLSGIYSAESKFISQCSSEGIQVNSSGVIIDESGCTYSWAVVTAYLHPGSGNEQESQKAEAEKKEKEQAAKKDDASGNNYQSTFANFEGMFESINSSVQIPVTFTVFA